MDYFPLFLDIRQQKVLIVGGGVIAWRKARLVTKAGGELHLVAPQILPELRELVAESGGKLWQRPFEEQDLSGSRLVFVAVAQPGLQRTIHNLAVQANIPCNVVDQQELCTFIVPAMVIREPVVIAITSAGAGPVVARRLREELEARLPDNYGQLAGFMKELRPLVQQRLPEAQRRYFYEKLWESQAAEFLAKGEKDKALELVHQILDQGSPAGMVHLAGAGPGDAALLTLQTLRLLHTADVIMHDKLVNPQILAMARRDAKIIAVGKPPYTQEQINRLLVKHAREGKQVVRLKGGDPAVFARLHEELNYLKQQQIQHEVYAGVTAALACAAAAKLSLTDRNLSHSLVFLSLQGKGGKTKPHEPRQLKPYVTSLLHDNAKAERTLVIYMGVENIDLGVAALISGGMPVTTPAMVFEKVGYREQRTFRTVLNKLPALMRAQQVVSPACIVIGKVIAAA